LGFALENFDRVGSYRTHEAGQPVDAASTMPDGTQFTGMQGLKQVLMQQQQAFVFAFTERLLTYALGRGLEAPDQATVPSIARAAQEQNYAIQALIYGIVT